MARLNTRNLNELSLEAQEALEKVTLNGTLAEVYLQFANSEPALLAYLRMEASLKKGELSDIELEAVKLWVSQKTGCEYCLSVHTFKARKAGLDAATQQAIRSGETTGNKRLDTLLKITQALYCFSGSLSELLLNEAREAGICDAALVDLTMAISTIFFTNITNHINDTKSSLPSAPVLNSLQS